MPGTNAGTGCPLTLRCARCKVGIDFRDYHQMQYRGTNLEATGRTRPLPPSKLRSGSIRVLRYLVEYRCRDCRHVGWSRHQHAELLLKLVGGVPLQ